jgi:metacaspase-1
MAKKAVCIGINDYPGTYNDLSGCVNDADDWATLFKADYGFDSVTQLKDSQATMSAMKAALEGLVTGAGADDVIVFTYSGHGTWVPDGAEDPDEMDNRDEALCAYDGLVLDDEIRGIIAKLTPGARLTVISDSCFSGGVTRAALRRGNEAVARGLMPSEAPKPRYMPPEDDTLALQSLRLPVRRRIFYPESGMSEILITGCNALEYSYDAHINGRWNGAMSAHALQIIRTDTGMSYLDFHKQLRRFLPSSQYNQRPQLEGPSTMKSRPLFS